ncbi:MAG: T9SS type A sorting domain-containing protein [Chlorobi bacterium]|nr:T9SS type A sorting domain-containing protein [Chlorobiota bacterium]
MAIVCPLGFGGSRSIHGIPHPCAHAIPTVRNDGGLFYFCITTCPKTFTITTAERVTLWDTASTTPYALPWNSPCVDAGTPMYEFGMEPPFIIQEDTVFSLVTLEYDTIPLPATDLAGNPRIVNGRIDMGAYEFHDTTTQVAQQYLRGLSGLKINVWPNPFTYNTFISFGLSQKSNVVVIVRDMQGRQTRVIMNAMVPDGKYSLTWNAKDNNGNEIKNGAYIIEVNINGVRTAIKKVVKKGKQ